MASPTTGGYAKPEIMEPPRLGDVDPDAPLVQSPKEAVERRQYGSTDSAFARQLQEEFNQEVASKEAKERFECPLCFDEVTLCEGVSLDCNHRLCSECFRNFLEVQIREKCVSEQELHCPMPKCSCPVSDHQVRGAVEGSDLWTRFLETRAELYRPDCPNERKCACPCGEVIIVETVEDEGFVTCPSCKEKVCFKCQERHEGSSCAAYWQWRKENDTSDKAFEELMSSEGWRNCPVCQAPCSRASGCNYMTCGSMACRNAGGTNFCYVCGEKLMLATEHFTHFPDGMFSDYCLNKRKDPSEKQYDVFLDLYRKGFWGWIRGFGETQSDGAVVET